MKSVLLIVLFALSATAADVYVRDGGSGSGSAWNDALDDLPATLTRGNTYWLADGAYANYFFDDADSGATKITIKKATVASHGTETGWDNAYGDGQAVWSTTSRAWDINGNHYIFDGSTGAGFGDTEYGFKIAISSTTGVGIYSDANAFGWVSSNITAMNIQIDLPQVDGTTYAYGFYLTGDSMPNTKTVESLTISNCWIKRGTIAINIGHPRNMMVERCSIEAQGPGDGDHHYAQIIYSLTTSNVTIRNNHFRDAQQVGWSTVIEPQGYPAVDSYIYGNVFYARTNLGYNSFCNEGIFLCAGSVSVDGLYFYNNTTYGWTNGNAGIFLDTGVGVSTDVFIRNNLWIECDAAGISDPNMVAVLSNNDTTATVGSVDLTSTNQPYNFRLTSAEGPGTSLSSPYDIDPDGITRGADGTWDRGAYEFNSAIPGSPAPVARKMRGVRLRTR